MARWPLQTLAVCNQKGGVGKTTTAVNMACGLAQKGYRVCLIDNDAQRNSSKALGIDIDALPEDASTTVIEIYADARPAIDLVQEVEGRFDGNLSVIPAHQTINGFAMQAETMVFQLAAKGASFEDQQDMRLEMVERLRESLKSLAGEFDVCVIDTPPSLGFMLTAALRASDWYIVPLICSEYCKDGVRDLMKTVGKVTSRGNPRLRFFKALLGAYDGRKTLHQQDRAFYETQFKEYLYPEPITHGVRMEELPSNKLSIFEHAPESDQAAQFSRFIDAFTAEVDSSIELQAQRQAKRELAAASQPAAAQPTQAAVGEG